MKYALPVKKQAHEIVGNIPRAYTLSGRRITYNELYHITRSLKIGHMVNLHIAMVTRVKGGFHWEWK